VDGATPDSGFGIDHLPFGLIAGPRATRGHLAVRIGAFALDLARVAEREPLDDIVPRSTLRGANLNRFLALSATSHRELRARLQRLLCDATVRIELEPCLRDLGGVRLLCPLAPPDFVDFYASDSHARRAQLAMGGGDQLAANWYSMPVGYHSRTGSIVATGAAIRRPCGQVRASGAVSFAPTAALDFELEVGFVVRSPSAIGERVSVDAFPDQVFGIVLLNDWSARDLQRWESAPLGPFHGKSFATQVGAWVTPIEALLETRRRSASEGTALPYLQPSEPWDLAITLEAALETSQMRARREAPVVLANVDFAEMHWNGAQQLAHLTANGAPLRAGDLFGSGTASGAALTACGCLLELTEAGRRPLTLANGEHRTWLEDGDRVMLRGWAQTPRGRITLSEMTGLVAPAAIKPTDRKTGSTGPG
jgi:fumarylacetoacetase